MPSDITDPRDEAGALIAEYAELFCPGCGARHLDECEWSTRFHHTHLCAHCGKKWRVVPYTFGVTRDAALRIGAERQAARFLVQAQKAAAYVDDMRELVLRPLVELVDLSGGNFAVITDAHRFAELITTLKKDL